MTSDFRRLLFGKPTSLVFRMSDPSSYLLVVDLDNTIYDYVAFYGKAFRAMQHVLSKAGHVSEDQIALEFKELYARTGTLDFRDLVQNLPSVRNRPVEEIEQLVRYARRAYDLSKRKQLRAYTDIVKVLSAVDAAGVTIVAATNAPVYHAFTRLRDVGLLDVMSGLVAWEGTRVEEFGTAFDVEIVRTNDEVIATALSRIGYLNLLPKAHLKPNPRAFMDIKRDFIRERYYSLGDSIAKDLAPAASVGMSTIWAKYGMGTSDPRDLDTILHMTPWSQDEIDLASFSRVVPDFILNSPLDLLAILPNHWQLSLFN